MTTIISRPRPLATSTQRAVPCPPVAQKRSARRRRRVHRGVGVVRHQLDRAQCQGESAVDLADRGQGAAGVAIAFGPIRRQRDQALIGRRRFGVAVAITEQPGAKLSGIAVVRG